MGQSWIVLLILLTVRSYSISSREIVSVTSDTYFFFKASGSAKEKSLSGTSKLLPSLGDTWLQQQSAVFGTNQVSKTAVPRES